MKQEKDIWTYRVHSRRLTICYTPESIRHPAKMHLGMCRQIIKLYSKKGDTILDPMCGIGTTIIEGMLLGRNVIGVEYEKKFVDMTKANIEKTSKKCSFIKSLGKGIVIKGDSRKLSELLNKSADVIISSPPYSEAIQRGGGIAKEGMPGDPGLANRCYHKGSTNPDMIEQVKEKADKFAKKYPDKRNVLMESYLAMKGDPRYKNQRRDWLLGPEYSKDSGNIGNLSHGKIDSIITSPPYEMGVEQTHMTSNKRGDPNDPNYRPSWKKKLKEGYAESKRPYSQPDTIITSPPYSEGIGHGGGRKNPGVNRDKGIWTQGAGSYSKDKNNVGEMRGKNYLTEMLKVYQQCFLILKNNGFMILVLKNFVRKGVQIRLDLDTIKLVQKAGFKFIRRHYRIITNPSFWITNAIQKYEKKHPGEQHPYPLEEDILVFKKLGGCGVIDTVTFSPPFVDTVAITRLPGQSGMTNSGEGYSKYSDDPANIGNLKY